MFMYRIAYKILRLVYCIQAKNLFLQADCDIKKIDWGADVPGPFVIHKPDLLKVGDGTSMSGRMYIHALGGVDIGRCCHIAQGLTIYSHNHNWKSEEYIPYDNKNIYRPVSIGDAVWIGANVTISPGTKIGNGVIISSGSVVFGDVPDCAIIRGNPAEIIAYRDKEIFKRLYDAGKMI